MCEYLELRASLQQGSMGRRKAGKGLFPKGPVILEVHYLSPQKNSRQVAEQRAQSSGILDFPLAQL